MLVRIKSLRELIKTEGIKYIEGDYHYSNDNSVVFVDEMKHMCGRVIEVKLNEDEGQFETMDGNYYIVPWFCSEWDIQLPTPRQMEDKKFKGDCKELESKNKRVLKRPIITTEIEVDTLRGKEMNKVDKHKSICDQLNKIYKSKNHDYGDSFGETYKKLGIISAITRITDKVNRLQSLTTKEQKVKDESIEDTLMDLANYSIMTLIELKGKEK